MLCRLVPPPPPPPQLLTAPSLGPCVAISNHHFTYIIIIVVIIHHHQSSSPQHHLSDIRYSYSSLFFFFSFVWWPCCEVASLFLFFLLPMHKISHVFRSPSCCSGSVAQLQIWSLCPQAGVERERTVAYMMFGCFLPRRTVLSLRACAYNPVFTTGCVSF
ncbi:hypothetical protein BJV74DRAFT_596795 [Russula compacta]|nr:hypothetical protein BJV74DRAFT_596795 [Russula compacta]